MLRDHIKKAVGVLNHHQAVNLVLKLYSRTYEVLVLKLICIRVLKITKFCRFAAETYSTILLLNF